MVEIEDIDMLVRKYFKYLIDEFNFVECGSDLVLFVHSIKYCKANLIVEVRYAYRNEFIEPRIYNKNFLLREGVFKDINLPWILIKNNPSYDYKDYIKLMPSEIGLQKSMENIASLFKDQASKFLQGKEWSSWDDIAGYKYPDENSIIETKIEINYNNSKS